MDGGGEQLEVQPTSSAGRFMTNRTSIYSRGKSCLKNAGCSKRCVNLS